MERLTTEPVPASYRDPAGFVYRRAGVLYRQVNKRFAVEFKSVLDSGLYEELTAERLLVKHRLVDSSIAASADAAFVLEPERVPFISYPYEWSFGQLRDAALLTLEIERRALKRGLTLRDASAFNVQFVDGRPIFIDTLSFAPHREGRPWVAYRQFCEHFLAPLTLIARRHPSLGILHCAFPDGVPLDVASRLLDRASWLRLGTALHLHLHALAQRRYASRPGATTGRRLSTTALVRLVDHLRRTVEGLRWEPAGGGWAAYEDEHGYDAAATASKEALVAQWIAERRPDTVWDLGANTGRFSRIAARAGARVLAIDADPASTELHYRRTRGDGAAGVLPLVIDLRNPSPASGWAGAERLSLAARGPADLLLALAIVHHLTLGGHAPLGRVATLLAELGRALVIEFVPLEDAQAQRLLAARAEPPHAYSLAEFEAAFAPWWRTRACRAVEGSGRLLYLMTRRADDAGGA